MNQKTVKTGMILISYIAVLFLLVVYFKEILSGINTFLGYATPFIIGLVLAFFLNPPYRFFMGLFKKIKIPETLARLFSTILVLLLAYGLITGIVMIVIPQVTSNFKNFFSNFDQYLNSLQNTLNNITEKFDIENFDLNLVIEFIKNTGIKIQNSITEWGPQAFTYTRRVISSITGVLIGIIFSIYILNARDRILRQIHRLSFAIFSEKVFKILYHIGRVILKTFDNYVVGQSIEAMILGSLCYIGMLSFNFAYPGLISVVVAVTALVPIVGTIVGGAIGFFLYLLVDPVRAFIFLIFFTVLQQLENNLIYPKVVGSKIGLPGLWVLFAVMIGSQVGGLIGMLFGVPIFTVIYTLLKDLTIYKEKEKLKKVQVEESEELQQTAPESPSASEMRHGVEEAAKNDSLHSAVELDSSENKTCPDEHKTVQEHASEPSDKFFANIKETEAKIIQEQKIDTPLSHEEKTVNIKEAPAKQKPTDCFENASPLENSNPTVNNQTNHFPKKRIGKHPSLPGKERTPFFFGKNKKQ